MTHMQLAGRRTSTGAQAERLERLLRAAAAYARQSMSRCTATHECADSRTSAPTSEPSAAAGDLRAIVGALLTYGLIVAVLMLVISATTWAIASSSGSWHTAQKAKLGCFVAIGGAALTGAALTWANWLLDIGPHL